VKPKRYGIDTLWHTVSELGLAWRDEKLELVFVKSMLRHQAHGDKAMRSAAAQIKTLHNSVLINKFIDFYPEILGYGIDRVSEFGNPKQEQEQEHVSETPPSEALQTILHTNILYNSKEERELFALFWEAYPRKEGKKPAWESFHRLHCDELTVELMIYWLGRAVKSEQWGEKKFVPHASTWLNQRRWEGDVPPLREEKEAEHKKPEWLYGSEGVEDGKDVDRS